MGILGWDYPPGAAGGPNAPYNQDGATCPRCGLEVDEGCECPECPGCGEVGRPVADGLCECGALAVRSTSDVPAIRVVWSNGVDVERTELSTAQWHALDAVREAHKMAQPMEIKRELVPLSHLDHDHSTVMIVASNMWLGIEVDGYTHS